MANKRRHEGEIERSWSDLPIDVSNEITGRLYLFDRIRFRGVCKKWRLADCVQPAQKLPWLMTHSWGWDSSGNILSECKFHCPPPDRPFTKEHKMEVENWDDLFGASVCASKFGWLLLQRSEKVFCYNPYAEEILNLPDIDISFNRSTFSSIPTLPDCVFFVLYSSKGCDRIRISICHHGDLQWTTDTYDGLSLAIEDVVYSYGTFYCVFSGGVLGAYSVSFQEWKLLTGMGPITGITFRSRIQMVESDGDLLLVCPSESFHIFRFDWSLMAWVKQNSLGNKALLLGCTSYSVSAVKETSALADRIYYHGDKTTWFYSLETHKHHKCSEFYPWVTQRATEKIWIEPPQV
ncbi:unnamed protein product [Ilex paraguariensis]|uniref:DUF295 domain-containing protein n=1 Tax=Ilex paraguariensis TaxID=185542 RepID=A0ABC8UTG4_9AQUA